MLKKKTNITFMNQFFHWWNIVYNMIFVTVLNNEELTYIGNKRKKIDREKQKDFRVPFAKLKFETSHLYSLSLFEWKVTTLLLQTWQPTNSPFTPKQRKLLPSFLLKQINLSLRLPAAKRKLQIVVSSPSSFISRSCPKKGNPLFVFVALLYSQEDASFVKP